MWEKERASALEIYTDACNTGYGARYVSHWFKGQWTKAQLRRAMETQAKAA